MSSAITQPRSRFLVLFNSFLRTKQMLVLESLLRIVIRLNVKFSLYKKNFLISVLVFAVIRLISRAEETTMTT